MTSRVWLVVALLLSVVDAMATKPKPLVLTPATARPTTPSTVKPSTLKPTTPTTKPTTVTTKPTTKPTEKPDVDIDGGGGDTTTTPPPAPVANYVLYPMCTDYETSLIMNPMQMDVQQCVAFSTYTFGLIAPTTLQKSLLCGSGCWNLIDRLEQTPIPPCSVSLNGYGINYIDALYVVFGDCVADPSKADLVTTNAAGSTTTTTTPMATPASSASGQPCHLSVVWIMVVAMWMLL